jgi:hypothetical protein
MLEGVGAIQFKFACPEDAKYAKDVLEGLGIKPKLEIKKKYCNLVFNSKKDVSWILRAIEFAGDIEESA